MVKLRHPAPDIIPFSEAGLSEEWWTWPFPETDDGISSFMAMLQAEVLLDSLPKQESRTARIVLLALAILQAMGRTFTLDRKRLSQW